MKRLAWYTIIILTTITGLLLLWQLRFVLFLLLLSLAVAAAVRPLVDRFSQKRVPHVIALVLAYILLFGALLGLAVLLSGALGGELQELSNKITSLYNEMHTRWPNSTIPIQQMIARQLPPPAELFANFTDMQGIQSLVGITTNLSRFFGSLGVIIILSMYWSADSSRFEKFVLSLIDIERRPMARSLWAQIEESLGAYTRSEFIQSLLAGMLLWLGYRLLGIHYATLLASTGALVALVPWFGVVIAIALPVLAEVGGQFGLGLAGGGYAAIVFIVLKVVIEPRINGRKGYSSLVLVLVIMFLMRVFGVLGLMLAPLVSAAIQISFKQLMQPRYFSALSYNGVTHEELADKTGGLDKRLDAVRESLHTRGDLAEPEIISLTRRLEALIGEAKQELMSD